MAPRIARPSIRLLALLALGTPIASPPNARAQGEIHQFVGAAPGDVLGWSVAGCGDVNQDGFPDVIAGARYEDTNGIDAGAAYVYSGKDGVVLHTFLGDQGKDSFGVSVDGAGDVDADGFADLIVGATGWNFGVGLARVFTGKTGATLHTFFGPGFGAFGWSVEGAGDLDNDGHADVAVGALFAASTGFESGMTRAFSGATGTLLFQLDGALGYWEGYAVDGAGDVNGDGFGDLLSTAPHAPFQGVGEVGRVRLSAGPSGATIRTVWGTQMFETMGISASGLGDLNGDGIDDVAAGSPVYTPPNQLYDAGRVQVFSGADLSVLWTADGQGYNAHLGQSVGSAGDVNGDGVPDVIVGSPDDLSLTLLAGTARVYDGPTGAHIGTLPGDPFVADFGYSADGVGDVDGDGVPDLVAGAPEGVYGGPASGHARVVSGACLSVHAYGAASPGSGGFAPALITTGGLPAIGNSGFGLQVTGGLGGAPAALLIGIAPAAVPVTFGTLLVDVTQPYVLAVLALGGSAGAAGAGQVALPAPIPNQVALVGATGYLQVLVGDPGATAGVAATQGLELGICR